MKRLIRLTTALLAVALFLFAPSSAGAWKAYQGDDYSETINNDYGFKVCNVESDGRAVYGVAEDAYYDQVVEWDGGDAGCDSRTNPPEIKRIAWLRTCEEIQNWPNSCGRWVPAP